MIDTHCHLDSPRFDADRPEVLERAWAAGVRGVVVPAVAPATWQALTTLGCGDGRIVHGLGIHPQVLPDLDPAHDDAHLEQLDGLLGQGTSVAVGECGLDGPSQAGAPLERQVRVFRRHLALARKHSLPILVHCLRTHDALLEVLEDEAPVEAGILLHSYSGSADQVRTYLRAGCHFSFAGPVSFVDARRPLVALRAVPLDRLMAETDAPDQAPHPHRGQRSEPAYLSLIVEAMARALGRPLGELKPQLTDNAVRFFRTPFDSR